MIWTDDRFAVYRSFFNVLAKIGADGLEQHETIYRFHDDWRSRCQAPYWLFDGGLSAFNLTSPLHLATYKGEPGRLENWRTSDERVRSIRHLLLHGANPKRALRSTNFQRAHPPLNLAGGYRSDRELTKLRFNLIDLLEE